MYTYLSFSRLFFFFQKKTKIILKKCNYTQLIGQCVFLFDYTSIYFQVEMADSTITTFSQLSFTATRYENGINFRCEADNIVMQNELEKPLQSSLFLIVMCKLGFLVIFFICFGFGGFNGIFRLVYLFRSTRGDCITA